MELRREPWKRKKTECRVIAKKYGIQGKYYFKESTEYRVQSTEYGAQSTE